MSEQYKRTIGVEELILLAQADGKQPKLENAG